MSRPTSWDDTPAPPTDARLLLELLVLVGHQAHDREDTGSLERAHIRFHAAAVINAHLDHLAALGLITARGARAPPPRVRPHRGGARVGRRAPPRAPARGLLTVCSRARYDGPTGEVVDWLEKVEHSDLARAWRASAREIRPTDGVLVLRTRGRTARPHDGPARRLDVVRWGLVPRGWRGPFRDLPDTWNARSETVATLSSFAPAWRRARRCVLVVSAAVEFPTGPPGGPPRARGVPAPRVAIGRADGGVLALGGIWEAWRRPGVPADAPADARADASDAWLLSCALLTTVPNAVTAPVHHRMPVVLAPDVLDAWLDPQLPLADARALCAPCADDVLRVTPAAVT